MSLRKICANTNKKRFPQGRMRVGLIKYDLLDMISKNEMGALELADVLP